MKRTVELLFLLAFVPLRAFAADIAGPLIWGAGNIECVDYLHAVDAKDRITTATVMTWAEGFLTATNMDRVINKDPPLQHITPALISAYIEKYCRDDTTQLVVGGVVKLSIELK